METHLSFGRWLQRRRKALDLTQAELGRRVGYARVTVHKIETDQLRPSRQMAERLADALEIAPAERPAFVRFARDDRRAVPPPVLVPLPERLAASPASTPRHNLPTPPSRFIGRAAEVATIAALARDGARLLTLAGPPGIGKTRLALEVATAVVDSFPDGVWLVDLAPVADPDLVAQTVALALGLRESSGQTILASLVEFARARRTLLVLDNCEHLVGACADLVATLLPACPSLRILATSRETLGIAGEAIHRVPSLTIPAPGESAPNDPVAAAEESEAVQLFLDRARLAVSAFALTSANVRAVATICQRLDGIPLAIELAAARVAVLSVEQIAERLDHRFQLLTGGSRVGLPRHRTLAALVDWSYDLLTPAEQTLFNRLAVFAGGFTLEAAERVGEDEPTAASGTEKGNSIASSAILPPRSPDDVLDLLGGLASKSLVVATRDDEGAIRYDLLETLRAYARERLDESGDAARVQERHAAYYLALAAATQPGPDAFDRLEREHNNLRAAMRWFLARGNADRATRLGAALWGFWAIRGYVAEGRQQLAVLLALPETSVPLEVRAEALRGAGRLAFNQGDFGVARARFEESLACWRAADNPRNVTRTLRSLGNLHREQGEIALARSCFEESLAISREADDREGVAFTLNYLGLLALHEGDFTEARIRLVECLSIYRDLREEWGVIWATSRLGHVAHAQGDLAMARRLYAESLATLRRWNDKRGLANLLVSMSMVEIDEGDVAGARARLRESAELQRELRDQTGTAMLLDAWAGLAAAEGRPRRALRLAEAAASLREASGARPARNLADWLDRVIAPARLALGEETTRAARAEGQALTLEQAVHFALEEVEET